MRSEEAWPLSLIAGGAGLSLLVFLCCALRMAGPAVFLLIAGAAGLAYFRLRPRLQPVPAFDPLPRTAIWILVAGSIFFSALYFFTALAPECSPDGASYHLSFVARYLREHGFVVVPYNLYSHLSQGIEMLFLFAFAFGRHSAAALVHYAFLIALAWMILAYARRIGRAWAGVFAALCVYTSPVAGIDAASAYVDIAVAAIIFATFYLAQVWEESDRPEMLVLLGFVAGFGYAAKYTAFLAVPYAVLFVLWRSREWRKAFLVAAASLVSILPWVLKNLLITGNPFSPMANRWFPNPFVSISFEREWSAKLRVYDLKDYWTLPWDLTVSGYGIPGLIGPVFLLIPVGFLAARTAAGRRLLFAGALFTLPYFGNIGARFFLPALPFWALAMGFTLAAWPRFAAALALLACISHWPGVVRLYAQQYVWAMDPRFPLPAALRIEDEDHWLGRKHPEYVITRILESRTPPGARIFAFDGLPEAYTSRDVAVYFQSAAGETTGDIFLNSYMLDYQCRLRQSLRLPSIQARRVRIVSTFSARNPNQEWAIHEVRLFQAGVEIPRSSEWRIVSRPNPWDIGLAFDNSRVTRWHGKEPVQPGQLVEVDLFRPQPVDEIALDTSVQQTGITFRVEIMDPQGGWHTFENPVTESALPQPGLQGRAAVAEVKARGFDYVLVDSTTYSGDHIDNPAAWNLTEVGRAGTQVLYRIDTQGPQLLPPSPGGR